MTGQHADQKLDVLDETHEDVIVIRVGRGTRRGYEELYSLLIFKTDQFGVVHVLEQAPNWTFRTFLSRLHGLAPDHRYGGTFRIGRYAAVGDSIWARLLFDGGGQYARCGRSRWKRCGTSRWKIGARRFGGSVVTDDDMFADYVEYTADRRLGQLELPERYGTQNPFPWMSEQVDLNKEKNFFETQVTEYQTGGSLEW